MHLVTSPLAETRVLPISAVSSSATVESSLSSKSAARFMRSPRSLNEVSRHCTKAVADSARAVSISSGVWPGYSLITSPVVGLIEVNDITSLCLNSPHSSHALALSEKFSRRTRGGATNLRPRLRRARYSNYLDYRNG